MTQAESQTKTRTKIDVPEPPLFRVIYLNDDQTPMEFVMSSLVDYFNYTADIAERIVVDIHETGSAVVAVLPYELAEQKGVEVTFLARQQGFPLQIKLEPNL